MELLCKNCLHGSDCYKLYIGDDCWDFSPLNDPMDIQPVLFPVFSDCFQGCSTLEEHKQMVVLQEMDSDSLLEEYPF